MGWNSNPFELKFEYKSPGSIGLLYLNTLGLSGYSRILLLESGYILTYILRELFYVNLQIAE